MKQNSMQIEATNNFIYLIRDETEKEKGGLLIPGKGQEKPHMGTIISIGELVKDKKIRKSVNKKGVFHKGTGFPIELEGIEYLVLTDDQIIGVEKWYR